MAENKKETKAAAKKTDRVNPIDKAKGLGTKAKGVGSGLIAAAKEAVQDAGPNVAGAIMGGMTGLATAAVVEGIGQTGLEEAYKRTTTVAVKEKGFFKKTEEMTVKDALNRYSTPDAPKVKSVEVTGGVLSTKSNMDKARAGVHVAAAGSGAVVGFQTGRMEAVAFKQAKYASTNQDVVDALNAEASDVIADDDDAEEVAS